MSIVKHCVNISYVVGHEWMNSIWFQCIVTSIWELIIFSCWILYKWDTLRLIICGCYSWEMALNSDLPISFDNMQGRKIQEKAREVSSMNSYVRNNDAFCWIFNGCYTSLLYNLIIKPITSLNTVGDAGCENAWSNGLSSAVRNTVCLQTAMSSAIILQWQRCYCCAEFLNPANQTTAK